ncbi:MAG: threonylcarbamoyl-AMP synthase [Anaerolineae bacterium UTCFX2]|jgi:L-threonylcarbamoyladenylate synthase|nr:threonylcarbamoyl-AMP synthase [Anaerolineae bacterium]MCZ7552580.1 L-threonylcarbamoyladenylate synthase [Anaerolineales bacterium]OQY87740.1 MAG: threonylcarbamoyl-AMP synthase [Anaerolineae bacterium UTCFX2]
MKTQIIPAALPEALTRALETLRKGQPVAFPTDTVYGIGASLWDAQAIERLFIVKDRPAEKAVAVLLGEPAALTQVAETLSRTAQRLAERFWPGALTLVVRRRLDLPDNLSPNLTIGVRMPDHPLALALLRRAGPLAVTSANLAGAANAATAQEVYAQLAGRIPLILDGGKTPGGLPSTVLDCTTDEPRILRPGPITPEMIAAALA